MNPKKPSKREFAGAMKAVIYCRVSTKEQTNNFSLPTQRKYCIEFCEKNSFVVDRVFMEEGESAKTSDRPELLKLLAYCRQNKGQIQAVVVYAISRLARNSYDFHAIKSLLAKLGINLRSVTEPTDETATGKLMEGILASFAQFDNDVKSERTITGMKAAHEQGQWPFQAPLGYLNVKSQTGGSTMVPDPDRGPLIQKGFELFSTGHYTKRQVLKIISNLGLRTRKGKPVSEQSFDRILRNSLYAGWMSVPAWGEPKKGGFEPLISEETFKLVGKVLSGKRPTLTSHVRNHPDFPLRRFVHCGKCDRPLTGSWSKGRSKSYPYYRCPNPHCRIVNVQKERFEGIFLAFLGHLSPRAEYVNLFRAIVLDVWRERQADNLLQIASLKNQLKTLERQMQQLINAFLYRNVIEKAIFDDQLGRLREEITVTEMDLHQLHIEELDIESLLDFSHYVLINAPRLWTEASLDQKQRLQKVLFPEGLTFCEETFGTTKTSLIFNLLEAQEVPKANMASPAGFEPALPP